MHRAASFATSGGCSSGSAALLSNPEDSLPLSNIRHRAFWHVHIQNAKCCMWLLDATA
jgi:hypothetical protein